MSDDAISRKEVLELAVKIELDDGQTFFCISPEDVETLSPVNPIPCEDAISRQAAIRINELHHGQMPNHINHEIWEELKGLPSVTPMQRTGHWILARTFPTKLYDEYLNEYECSECYRRIRCAESQLVNYPYCHCGCRMVEPHESEG